MLMVRRKVEEWVQSELRPCRNHDATGACKLIRGCERINFKSTRPEGTTEEAIGNNLVWNVTARVKSIRSKEPTTIQICQFCKSRARLARLSPKY